MKMNRLFVLLTGLLPCFGLISVKSNTSAATQEVVGHQNIVRDGVKKASIYTYTFPENWVNTLLGTGLYTYSSGTYVNAEIYVSIFKVQKIYFNKNLDQTVMPSQIKSYVFDKNTSSLPYDDIMVEIYPAPTVSNKVYEPTIIQFYAPDVDIVAGNHDYFDGLGATTYVFNNFKFSSRTQYETVMSGTSSSASVSGTSVPKEFTSISQLKEVLAEVGGSSYYKSVTSIAFSSDSSSISGFTDTGYSIGTTKIYKKGNEIVFYDTSKTVAPADISSLFSNCTALKTIDLTNLDTSKVTTCSDVFSGCSALTTIVAPSLNSGVSMNLPYTYYDSAAKKDVTSLTSDNSGHTLTNHKAHSLVKTAAKDATCNEEGNLEYYTCSICGSIFSDKDGTSKLDSAPTIDKLGHVIEETITLSDDKTSANIVLTCKNDNKTLANVTSKTISAGQCTKPTCEEDGKQVYEITYEYDGQTYNTKYEETLTKTGHSYKYEANLSSDGKSATIDVLCENEDNKKIDTIDSSNVDVTENVQAATHFKDGKRTYTISFEYDGKTQTITKEETISKLTDKLTYTCIPASDTQNAQVKITSEDGTETYVDAAVTLQSTEEPTCTQKGKKTYEYSFTFEGEELTQTYEEELPLKEHELEYETEIVDETHATVYEKCKNEDGNVIKTDENVSITQETNSEGSKTYYVTVNGETIDVTAKVNSYLRNLEKNEALASIKTKAGNYNVSTIKNEEGVKTAIDSLIAEIETVSSDYSGELSEEENNELSSIKANLSACLTKLTEVEEKKNSLLAKAGQYETTKVKSSDKEDISKTINDIETFLSENESNLTDEEKASLVSAKTNLNSCSEKITQTGESVTSVTSKVNSYSESSIKSSDKGDLNDVVANIDSLVSSDNLTEEEKTSLLAIKTKATSLIKKIDDTKAELESLVSEASKHDSKTAKSSDKDSINSKISEIDSFLNENGNNLTDEEKTSLASAKTNLTTCISKINEVEEAISSATSKVNEYEESSVKTSDKEDINSAANDIDVLLSSDNLTEEERTSLVTAKSKAQRLLKKIADTEQEINEIKETLSNENSTQEEKDEALAKAESLIESGNLTESEIASLNSLIEESKQSASELNLIWLIILLSVVVLVEIGFIAYKKIKENKGKTAKANSSLIPLLVLALASGAVGQIVACIILTIVAIALCVYIVVDVVTNKKK